MFAHNRPCGDMSIPLQRILSPLLRSIGCAVSQSTAGAETRRVHCARGARRPPGMEHAMHNCLVRVESGPAMNSEKNSDRNYVLRILQCSSCSDVRQWTGLQDPEDPMHSSYIKCRNHGSVRMFPAFQHGNITTREILCPHRTQCS